jgi:hypothetical protein
MHSSVVFSHHIIYDNIQYSTYYSVCIYTIIGVEFSQKMRVLTAVGEDAHLKPDQYLPKAHTCFFSINLPKYSTKEVRTAVIIYLLSLHTYLSYWLSSHLSPIISTMIAIHHHHHIHHLYHYYNDPFLIIIYSWCQRSYCMLSSIARRWMQISVLQKLMWLDGIPLGLYFQCKTPQRLQ